MRKSKWIFFMLIGLILAGCNMPWQKDDAAHATKKTHPPTKVSVFIAKKENIPINFEYPAKISSIQDVNIVAKVQGTLVEQYFKAGDFVKLGDKLFLIDPGKYEAAFNSANAALSVANATFNQAKTELNRARKLKTSNAISQKEYDIAVANYEISKAQVESAKAILQNSKLDLDYTLVTAPFDGMVGDPYKDIGTYVSLADAKLVRLTKLDPIYADFSIADVDFLDIDEKLQNHNWIQIGKGATLHFDGNDYNGTVVFIDKIIGEQTGSIRAKAKFNNTDGKILPGGFARVTMDGFYQKDGFKIPQILIQQDPAFPFVYTIKDGKVAKNIIKIVYQDPMNAVVFEGISDGDKIIADNFGKIGVGAPVSEVEAK